MLCLNYTIVSKIISIYLSWWTMWLVPVPMTLISAFHFLSFSLKHHVQVVHLIILTSVLSNFISCCFFIGQVTSLTFILHFHFIVFWRGLRHEDEVANNNNNNNTSICKAHNVSIRAESEAPEAPIYNSGFQDEPPCSLWIIPSHDKCTDPWCSLTFTRHCCLVLPLKLLSVHPTKNVHMTFITNMHAGCRHQVMITIHINCWVSLGVQDSVLWSVVLRATLASYFMYNVIFSHV